MPKWTKQQNDAITARNRNILVSAAAGSGKTAVLVERVVRMITDRENPVDIDRLLIVTFTNAAAAEMKHRISAALSNMIKKDQSNMFLRRQLSLLPNADICTIDSFCCALVKERFYDIGVSQDFSVLDDSEVQLLEDTVIDESLDVFFNENDRGFMAFVESFTTPNSDKELVDNVKKLLRFIYAQPFPYIWLDKAVKNCDPSIPFDKTLWYDYIKNKINSLFDLCLHLISKNIDITDDIDDDKLRDKFKDIFLSDLSVCKSFKKSYNSSWDEALKYGSPSFSRLAQTTKIDPAAAAEIKNNRNIYKNILQKKIPSFFISDADGYASDMADIYTQLSSFGRFVKFVDNKMMEEKKERNAYSFADIEHFAIDLLFTVDGTKQTIVRTPLAQELSSKYYEILVDEYQDTNEAQDLLFTYLSNGTNLFTVGDIKQSIYRFRLAMPNIFNSKKKAYREYDPQDNEKSSKIILDKNFRSRKEICSYVNFIFSNLMSEKLGELDYNHDEYLNCGADYHDAAIACAQIKILTSVKSSDSDEKEAQYIAETIIEKINSRELVKDGEKYRPIRYGDFAVLMRSLKGHINNYVRVFTEYGIPVICDNATNLFDNNEIKIMLSLLRTINNPTLEIPLLSTMMSPFYSFTADELADITVNFPHSSGLYRSVINSESEKVKNFIADLQELKKISVTMSVSAFIRYLVEEKGMIAYINAMGNADSRYQNILKLVSVAERFDRGVNVGLTAFLRYVDRIIESDKGIDSASVTSVNDDAVKIMSVHHSKGLEFPVCILAGSNRKYNDTDLNQKMLLNTAYGVGVKYYNDENMYQYKTVPYAVIQDKNTVEMMSENLRVLYVAMTRAKEQFITFITCDNLESKVNKLSGYIIDGRPDPYLCSSVRYDSDMFLLCALLHPDGEKLREFTDRAIIPQKSADFKLLIDISSAVIDETVKTQEQSAPYDDNIITEIDNRINYSYEWLSLENTPGKIAASALDSVENAFAFTAMSKPSFMNEKNMTAAQKGTAMHTFMQYCSYENCANDIEQEIIRLEKSGFITTAQADSLDREKLKEFFNGPIADRLFSADKIYREIKMSSFVSADMIYDTDYKGKVLVQGIADCVFEENGELVVLDYKTDRVKDESELLERYRKQIAFYVSAVEKTFKKPVKQSMLYSFYMGRECVYK